MTDFICYFSGWQPLLKTNWLTLIHHRSFSLVKVDRIWWKSSLLSHFPQFLKRPVNQNEVHLPYSFGNLKWFISPKNLRPGQNLIFIIKEARGSPNEVVANILDCDIVVNEFEFQSLCHINFRTNIYGKDMNPLISQANHQIVPRQFF